MPLGWIKAYNFNKKNHKIVIWSEAKHYWSTFSPVVRYLQARKIDFIYLASDKDDKGMTACEQSMFVGKNWNSFLFLKNISADIMLMTTPGLGDLAIKRSAKVKHYCHILHAPTDITSYRRIAFECFDSIFCSNKTQIDNIRLAEKTRSTMAKQLYEVGCLYYDDMVNEKGNAKTDNNTIIICPTWGLNNCLKYADKLINPLIDNGFTVIIRPHPQSFKSEKKFINDLMKKYPEQEKIKWDIGTTGKDTFAKSAVMISDLSGVMFDFAFVYQKPVISIDAPINYKDTENEDLNVIPWELTKRSEIGQIISHDELDKLPEIATQLSGSTLDTKIIHNSVFNFGNAENIAGETIEKIINNLGNDK